MPDLSSDHLVRELREQLSDNDLVILDAVNKRLSLVNRLHEYKRAQGYDIKDPGREDWMLSYVTRANRGPLSADAARQLFQELIRLTTAEAARLHAEKVAAEGAAAPGATR